MSLRASAALVVMLAVVLGWVGVASAHPLGNFTVNRYARVEVAGPVVRVYYVLDEAEIPAFQDRNAVRADPEAFAQRRLTDILAHLSLTIAGRPVAMTVTDHLLTQPPGQGGLPTLRLAAVLEAPAAPAGDASATAGGVDAVFADGNEADRIGWREIVVTAKADSTVLRSTAPGVDSSNELRTYPANLIQAPLDLRQASFRYVPGQQAVTAVKLQSPTAAPTRSGSSFTSLVDRQHLTPWVLAGMLAIATVFGAAHALAPGHGKTVMAAYLVGTRGRPRDAVLLGVVVSAMHTASVLVLGIILFRLSRNASVDRIYPWLKIASGLLVAGLGVWMLRSRLGALRASRAMAVAQVVPSPALVLAGHGHVGHDHGDHGHDHPHADNHGHDHPHADDHGPEHPHADDHGPEHPHADDHGHDHPHGDDHDGAALVHSHGGLRHSHELPEGVAPLSRRGILVLATAGGLFPSPSALVVLVSAFTLGRTVLGLALVGAFSVGLAATLTAVGLLLVYGKRVAMRRPGLRRAIPVLPVAGAGAIAFVGAVLLWQGASTIH